MTHSPIFNPKTPIEYMLGKVSEECSEITQIIEKIRTFGFGSLDPKSGRNNHQLLQAEILDFHGSLIQLNAELNAAGLPPLTLDDVPALSAKLDKIERYSLISIRDGLLERPLTRVGSWLPAVPDDP